MVWQPGEEQNLILKVWNNVEQRNISKIGEPDILDSY